MCAYLDTFAGLGREQLNLVLTPSLVLIVNSHVGAVSLPGQVLVAQMAAPCSRRSWFHELNTSPCFFLEGFELCFLVLVSLLLCPLLAVSTGLRKAGSGLGLGGANSEFSIQNEDFPALPGMKGQ